MDTVTISDIIKIMALMLSSAMLLVNMLKNKSDTEEPRSTKTIAMHIAGFISMAIPLLSAFLLSFGWPKLGLSLSVISTVLFTGYYCFLRPPVRPTETVVLVLHYIGASWIAAAVLAMQFAQALKT